MADSCCKTTGDTVPRLRALAVRILNLFRRRHLERDLRDQLESHLQMLEDEFVRRGMDPQTARTAAKRAVGSQLRVQELVREQHGFNGLDTFVSDIRLAARRLRRQPSTATVSILALAGGIAATGITWSLASALLLHPLSVHDPDRLVIVGTRFNQHGFPVYSSVRESGVFE